MPQYLFGEGEERTLYKILQFTNAQINSVATDIHTNYIL